jgi:signal transduction histidine kinase/ActR/RegA family two-component response regulator
MIPPNDSDDGAARTSALASAVRWAACGAVALAVPIVIGLSGAVSGPLMVLVPILPVVMAGLVKERAAIAFGAALFAGVLVVGAGRSFGLLPMVPHGSLSALFGGLGVALTTALCHVDGVRRAALEERVAATRAGKRALDARIEDFQVEVTKNARLATIGQLAAGVGHEVNNPLAYIVTNLEFVADTLDPSGDPEIRSAVADARDGAERIRQIVRELQVLSRTDESVHTVDLNTILERSIRMAGTQIRQAARLVQDLRVVPPLTANETRLGQVFLNLLVNAAQAIGEGRVEENEIRVTSYTDARGLAIVEIKDSGPGMAADVHAKIFQPFFTTKRSGAGTGLGLSICHTIIAALGGDISVESAPGKGTLFRVSVPPPAFLRERKVTLPAVASGSRMRVLVVDDEPLICRAIQKSLAADHDVTIETNPRHALERLRSGERFDLVLCDLMMPDLSGMDLYQALKASAPEVLGHVVFMTGGVFSARAREFMKSVPNTLLEKPLNSKRLRAIIAESTGLQDGLQDVLPPS